MKRTVIWDNDTFDLTGPSNPVSQIIITTDLPFGQFNVWKTVVIELGSGYQGQDSNKYYLHKYYEYGVTMDDNKPGWTSWNEPDGIENGVFVNNTIEEIDTFWNKGV